MYGAAAVCAPSASCKAGRSAGAAAAYPRRSWIRNRLPFPISFLSDYGLADEFVGVVHGVILRIAPQARVIDVTHGVRRGDVRGGALALVRAVQYLPPGVALAVVDPGVGTGRRGVAVATAWGYFIGPDNGLLAPAVAMTGGAGAGRLPRGPALSPARRRDAPSTGATCSPRRRRSWLPARRRWTTWARWSTRPGWPRCCCPCPMSAEGRVRGQVWWVDGFGNAQTNVSPDDLRSAGLAPGEAVLVEAGGDRFEMVWAATYGEGPAGVVLVDSYGLVAVALPGGRADEAFGLAEGTAVSFGPVR